MDCYAEKSIQGGDICSLFHVALFLYKIGQIPSLAQAVDNSFKLIQVKLYAQLFLYYLIPDVFVTFQE